MTAIAADLMPTTALSIPPITAPERAAALDALAPILAHYGQGPERAPRTNLTHASNVLLRADAHVALHKDLWASLPPTVLDPRTLTALRPLGVGCREAAAAVLSKHAHATEARLSVDLLDAATALKQRVLRYTDYNLVLDGPASREIADIRSGIGYFDLEADLRRLAVLLDHHAAAFDHDPYRDPEDSARCRALADAIGAELSAQAPTSTSWENSLHAALRRVYHDEVRPAAAFIFRRSPADLAAYSSIYTTASRPRRAAASPADPADPSDLAPAETNPTEA